MALHGENPNRKKMRRHNNVKNNSLGNELVGLSLLTIKVFASAALFNLILMLGLGGYIGISLAYSQAIVLCSLGYITQHIVGTVMIALVKTLD